MVVLTDPKREDWPAIIAAIEAAGITHYKIACMMHRQYNQVTQWKKGTEPKHYEGQMLLMIHAEYVVTKVIKSITETTSKA